MVNTQTLTESEVKDLVYDWYHKLDVHAPVEELLPMLADEELEMRFPEGTMRGHDGFKQWYDTVTRKFFDETHNMKELNIDVSGDRADVKLVVNWQAKVWNPPAPKSEWLGFDAAQTWVVQRSPDTHVPVVLTYIVDSLDPMEGSATL